MVWKLICHHLVLIEIWLLKQKDKETVQTHVILLLVQCYMIKKKKISSNKASHQKFVNWWSQIYVKRIKMKSKFLMLDVSQVMLENISDKMDSRTSTEWMDAKECYNWLKKANPIMNSMRYNLMLQMRFPMNFKICTISSSLQAWSVTIVPINVMNSLEEQFLIIYSIVQKLAATSFLLQTKRVKKNAMRLLLCFSKNSHGNMSKSTSIIDSTKPVRNQVNRSTKKYTFSKNLIHKKKWRKDGLSTKKWILKEKDMFKIQSIMPI